MPGIPAVKRWRQGNQVHKAIIGNIAVLARLGYRRTYLKWQK